METALLLVALAVVVLAGTALAGRLQFPAPLLLIVIGAAASYLPFVPEVRLSADIVLVGLLPPLLYATAIKSSLVEVNANRGPILALSVGLVVFTTLGVGVVVHALLPEIGWAGAFALGAVVAPPDAVAATAVARRIGLPRRIVTILEGESLLNDATALVALRTAVAAIAGGVTAFEIGSGFLLAAGGGVAVGFVVFLLVAWVRRRVVDPVLDTGVSLVVPFAAYVAAEEIHASGVISVVVAGLLLGHKAPVLQSPTSRIAERVNWLTIAYMLENAVFLLIGLQAHWLIADVQASSLPGGLIAAVCAATLVAVIVLRLVWLFGLQVIARVVPGQADRVPGSKAMFLVGWAGMRGVVTLAAAFVIPTSMPHREVLLLAAFTVVAGTLFGQGLTLPAVARRLHVTGPDPAEDALARATLLQQASQAGLAELDAQEAADADPHHADVYAMIRDRVEQRNFAAWERLNTNPDAETPSELYVRARCAMIEAERAWVLEVRSTRSVASEVIDEVLQTLDVEESMFNGVTTRQAQEKGARLAPDKHEGECIDLRTHPHVAAEPASACPRCLELGLRWVALRRCLICGNVACCDSSPGKHATAHFEETGHPVMQSAEPDEGWRWCYVHQLTG